MSDVNKVYHHLSHVQKMLNVPKNRKNSFGNYMYRSCEDIVEAVKRIMPEGCYLTLTDSMVMIGDRIYVKAIASFCYEGFSVYCEAFAREAGEKKGMDAAQVTGSSSSYARKYALNGLFAIDDNKDIDEEDHREQVKDSRPKSASNSAPEVSHIVKAFKQIIAKDDKISASEKWQPMLKEIKSAVWKLLTADERQWMNIVLKSPIPLDKKEYANV